MHGVAFGTLFGLCRRFRWSLLFLCLLSHPAAALDDDTGPDTVRASAGRTHSIYFNGELQGSIVRVPFNPRQNSYQLTRGLTFEAWIKPMRSDTGGTIINKAVGLCRDDWALIQVPPLGVEFKLANSCTGNNRFLERHHVLSLGRWHHVAGVWDGDSLRLFVDGRQLLRSHYSGTASANEIDMSIGANNHWDGNHLSFMGFIDEVRYSNVARYRGDFTPELRFEPDDSTVFLFHCDEGEGEILADASSSHLSAYGELITWSDDVPEREMNSRPEVVAHRESAEPPWWQSLELWILLLVLGGSAAGVLARGALRRRTVASTMPPEGRATTGAQPRVRIEVFGGFHVYGGEGVDLSGRFSEKIRELFLIVLLHTGTGGGDGRGIHTAALTAALWPDHDPAAAKNARGVSIKRLRDALDGVGEIRVVQHHSVWRIELGAGVQCDYLEFVDDITGTSPETSASLGEAAERFLAVVGRGRFLSGIDYSWLDPIRVDLETRIVERVARFLAASRGALPQPLVVQLADAGLSYEPVNEEFLCTKLRALTSLGRLSAAQAAYLRFSEEYQEIVGSPFSRTLQECSL
jgi:two-component SAPR family response regulator